MKGREVMGFAIWMISTWGCAALFLGLVFCGQPRRTDVVLVGFYCSF